MAHLENAVPTTLDHSPDALKWLNRARPSKPDAPVITTVEDDVADIAKMGYISAIGGECLFR
jgi:hypothetical protein